MGAFNNLLFGDLKMLTNLVQLVVLLFRTLAGSSREKIAQVLPMRTFVCPTQYNKMESITINYLIPDAISILPVLTGNGGTTTSLLQAWTF